MLEEAALVAASMLDTVMPDPQAEQAVEDKEVKPLVKWILRELKPTVMERVQLSTAGVAVEEAMRVEIQEHLLPQVLVIGVGS